MKTESLQDLYRKELSDVYGCAKLLVKTLPSLMDRAEMPELRQQLADHLAETREHLSRLERIFEIHGEKPTTKTGKALPGILREAEEDMGDIKDANLRDAAIAAAASMIAHYEISAYGMLHAYSIHLGYSEDGKLLNKILEEERNEDQKLTTIVLNHLKVEATRTA